MRAPAPSTDRVQFGVFELDLQRAELRKSGVKIKLQEQPLKILQILLENPGQIVWREELQKRIWPANTFVEFNQGLYSAMARLRDALGDSPESPRFIETLARRGYRFIAPIPESSRPEAPQVVAVSPAESPELRYVLSALAGLLGGALLLASFLGFNIAGAREWLRRTSNPPIHSLAVLPLENLSGDPEQEYFAAGMTDELITKLTMVGNVEVISRTFARQYKGTKKTLPQIGRELNVDAIVEGSVARSGNRIRITAELVRVANDQHLWAKDYERDVSDVLALQNELAKAIVTEINVTLTASERVHLANARSINPRAYQLYQQARFLVDQQGGKNLERAVDLFEQALELDAEYAPAWAGLGEAYMYQAGMGFYLPEETGWLKARDAVARSLRLDPDLAEAHAMMGQIQMFHDWDWQGAEASMRHAMMLEPSNATAIAGQADLTAFLGRPEVAISLDRRAITLDPLNVIFHLALAGHAYDAGRLDESLNAAGKALELNSEAPDAHWLRSLIHLELGRPREALAEAQLERNPIFRLQGLILAYAALGRSKESDAALKELIAQARTGGAFQIAEVHAVLGDAKHTCDWLERAYLQHDSGLPYVKEDRALRKVVKDPRYAGLLEKMHLVNSSVPQGPTS